MTTTIINDLQQLWLNQLVREFEDICFQYSIKLRLPLFELSNGIQQSGCWLPEFRTIKISRHLIRHHPWNVVLMVLKHEMAHQVCSEIFHSTTPGHNKEFRKACRMLGVPSPYNRASGDLERIIAEVPVGRQTASGRKIIERIGKLLSLAASDNEHEAALAMQRATDLLHRHNLNSTAVHQSACIRLIINTRSRQLPVYRRTICAILQNYFYVRVICSSLYDPSSNRSYKTIELLGRVENVPVAEHCYHFLEQQLAALWLANQHKFRGNKRTAKNSYYLGLLHGFSQKLARQAATRTTTRQHTKTAAPPEALTVRQDQTLQHFVNFHFPCLRKQSSRKSKIFNQPYNEAMDTGKTLVLHQCVTEKKKGIQGMLKSPPK